MAITKQLQIKRGDKANLPSEALEGELLFAKDTNEVFIGKGSGVTPIPIATDLSNVAMLNSDGKIDNSVLPPLAISETFVVDNETDQLALTVQAGDIAVRTDENKSYIALNDTNGSMSDWQELLTPTDAVTSVNGQTGAVTLTTDDIDEGSNNLYFTTDRAKAAASELKVQDLSDVSTTAPSDGQLLQYVSANNQYEPVDVDSVGRTTLVALDDTPTDYTGSGGYTLKVKDDESGVEFVDESVIDGGLF